MQSRPALQMLALGALVAAVAGCASSSGGGSYVADAGAARQPSCPAGETLICESRSPNRISDGRYGYKNRGLPGRCGCQPDRQLEKLEGRPLPSDRF